MSTNTNNNNIHKLNNNTSNTDKQRQHRPSSTTTLAHNLYRNPNLNPCLQYSKTNTPNYTMMTPNHKQHNTDTNIYK